jgi:hypothetical protein
VIDASGQEALGSTDGAASEAAGTDAGAVLGASVGLVEPAGVLQARMPPPSEAARARASRMRLNMVMGFLRNVTSAR